MFTLAETRGKESGGDVEKEEEISAVKLIAGDKERINNNINISIISLLDNLDTSDTAAVSAAVAAVQENASYLSNRHVTLHTSLGPIELELYWMHAPMTCINFFLLSKRGYYDGCLFHRVCRGKWAQSGDPTGTGRGGTSVFGKPFKDEIHPGLRHTGAGVLSMANSGINKNTSHFLLLFSPSPNLDGKNSIFGRIFFGLKTLKKISLVQTTKTDRPIYDIKIIRASVAEDVD